MKLYLIFLIYMAVMSLAAFILYAADKRKAKKNQWRTKEKTLLLAGFLGGAVGALAAMKLVRHKTKHWYFWVVNFLGLAWQAAALIFLFVKFK